jgi:competence protein ComGC
VPQLSPNKVFFVDQATIVNARTRTLLFRALPDPTSPQRRGTSAVVVATTLAVLATIAVLAAPALQEWRPEPVHSGCDQMREMIQQQADAYFLDNRRWPDRHLESLAADSYWGGPVEACPTTGTRYQMYGTVVACPVHETERTK